MALTKIAAFALRGLQILFGAVVLGLSIIAINWQRYGSTPAATGYSAFVGALAILVGLAGLASLFMTKFEMPILIADTLAALMLLAGGLAYAITLRKTDCGDQSNLWNVANKLLNGGCKNLRKENATCGYSSVDGLLGRCHIAEANAAFLFLGFAVAMAAAVLCILAIKKARKTNYGTRATAV